MEMTELGYDAAVVLIPESSPALACDALATLLRLAQDLEPSTRLFEAVRRLERS